MSIITLNTRSLPDSAVTTAKINADAVTDAKIADDVIGTEHLTAGEVDTTALGADAVTEAKIADDAVESEHLNDNIISGQTALTSSPDDTDELLISDAGTIKRIDVSLVGGKNTPNFYVRRNGTQTVSANTWTKVQLNSEFYDTASAFDSSSDYRFTVPSGQGGKYFFQASVYGYSGDNNLQRLHIRLYKNGSSITTIAENDWSNQAYRNSQMYSASTVLSLSASDYIELYANLYSGGGTPTINGDGDNFAPTRLIGFKLIE